jgi:hypothetical protein
MKSKIRNVAMFLIFRLEVVFNTVFVGMYVIYLRTEFNIPNFSGSLVTAMKPKDKYRFLATANLLFYI